MLQEFIKDIRETPNSNAVRLIFADWVGECGQEAYAEFIRLQCEPETYGSVYGLARAQVQARITNLEATHRAEWLEFLDIPAEVGVTFERGMPTVALAPTCLRIVQEDETAIAAMERAQTEEEAASEAALLAPLRNLPIINPTLSSGQNAFHLITAHDVSIRDLTLGGLTTNVGDTWLYNNAHAEHITTNGGWTVLWDNARVERLGVHGGTREIHIQNQATVGSFCVVHPETAEVQEVDISSNDGNEICEQIRQLARDGFLPSLIAFQWRDVTLSPAQLDAARANAPVIHSPSSNPGSVGAERTWLGWARGVLGI